MAKQVEEVTDERVESLKTVKFGGYDKASVDYYIDELKEKHNKEVEDLKENVSKLSEAVLSLKTMREVNMTESSKTIETLKKANSDLESELEALKEQVNAYKQRELENAGRYEYQEHFWRRERALMHLSHRPRKSVPTKKIQ